MALQIILNKADCDNAVVCVDMLATFKKRVVKMTAMVMMASVVFHTFAQTGRSNTRDLPSSIISNWEQPVYKTFKFVPDPSSNTTLRIIPGREDAGYWAGIADNGKKSETVVIRFKNVSSMLDVDYADNDLMLSIIDRTFSDRSIVERMDYMTVTGASSPDGYTDRNERLAAERALAIKNYIMRRHPHVDRDRIITFSAGEDWDGLRRLIEVDYNTPYRAEALKILDKPLGGEAKRTQLKQLASGRTYRYLSANMFPYLRGGAACIIYFKKDVQPEITATPEYETKREQKTFVAPEKETTRERKIDVTPEEEEISPKRETSGSRVSEYENPYQASGSHNSDRRLTGQPEYWNMPSYNRQTKKPVKKQYGYTNERQYEKVSVQKQYSSLYADANQYKRTALAVKTNLLFDVVTALNVELEAPIGESWSIAGEYIFPWWLNEEKQNCFQLIGGNLELRHWFGDRENLDRMTGWFGGIFTGGGYFDFERNKHGYQGEFYITTGFSAGYAHPISRDGKWRMEYSLGIGYLKAEYREYNARVGLDDEWHLIRQKSGNYSFFGPIRTKISLVWTINHK